MVSAGEQAPRFELVDTERRVRQLEEFLGKKTVLAFYPGAFTSTCAKEMCSFRDALAKLEGLNAQVVGISVNDPFSNSGFAEANQLNFPLLSDYDRSVIQLYGVRLDDFAGLPGYTTAQRAIFILDREGKIRYAWVADDPGQEPDYTRIMDELAKIP